MLQARRTFLITFIAGFILKILPVKALARDDAPAVLLAKNYRSGIEVQDYLVSEKLDGVRAVWDGKTLHTRSGKEIAAPSWFIQKLPNIALDGELWMGRKQFDALSSAVRKENPADKEWHRITYMVFELPNAIETFEIRAKKISELVKLADLPHLKAVGQFHVQNEAALDKKLKEIIALGGEGLMLHRADALYVTGRSDVLLKLKPLYDAEAKVVAHVPGRGKYQGKLGALMLETPTGIRFKLGTGFTDAQRENPPKVGSVVTYTYRDLTLKGKPKFASFLRERVE